jgi:hypothetical protein
VSALTLEPCPPRGRDRTRGEAALSDAAGPQSGGAVLRSDAAGLGGEPTLDALLAGVWEGLAAHKPVACPLCGGEMRPEYGAHARPLGGGCQSCGTRLS